MEKKINVAELLKNCPTDMELDCTMYDNVYFKCIREHAAYPIVCYTIDSKGNTEEITFSWYGKYALLDTAKCVIFPKGKTTWEGFVPPIQFRDGDIAATDCNCSESQLFIVSGGDSQNWNSETKTLEKLIKPIFKAGDKVRRKNNHNLVFTITSIEEDSYGCGANLALWFDDQDQYELVPNKFNINTLVPFESRVLVRYNKEAKWCPAIWGFYDYEKGLPHRYAIVGGITFAYCIPYEGNEHLLGKTEDCKDFYKTWE